MDTHEAVAGAFTANQPQRNTDPDLEMQDKYDETLSETCTLCCADPTGKGKVNEAIKQCTCKFKPPTSQKEPEIALQAPSTSKQAQPADMKVDVSPEELASAERMVLAFVHGTPPSYDNLLQFLRSHIKENFVLRQALSKGHEVFRLEFSNTAGATKCIGIGALVWGRRSVLFWKWQQEFSAEEPNVAPNATELVGHVIRVQFPNLHPVLQEPKWLRRCGSLIGDVLAIEDKARGCKRPAGPILHILVAKIDVLPGTLVTPSFDVDALKGAKVKQRILYSGLPNQCNRCRRFGHQARECHLRHDSISGIDI